MVTSEITTKLESLSTEDYNRIVLLIDRLAEKPSNVLRNAHNKLSEKILCLWKK